LAHGNADGAPRPGDLGLKHGVSSFGCGIGDVLRDHAGDAQGAPYGCRRVEECLEVLRQSFLTNRFGAWIYLPSYDGWFFRQDERESYRRYADVLRLIGAEEPDKRWLLKNPGHIAEVDACYRCSPTHAWFRRTGIP